MYFEREKKGECTVVRFTEKRIDVLVSQEVKGELFKILDEGINVLGFDFSNVQFVDSSGLGALVAVLKRLGSGGSMRMWGLSPELKSLFEITQLYKVFDIYELETDALTI